MIDDCIADKYLIDINLIVQSRKWPGPPEQVTPLDTPQAEAQSFSRKPAGGDQGIRFTGKGTRYENSRHISYFTIFRSGSARERSIINLCSRTDLQDEGQYSALRSERCVVIVPQTVSTMALRIGVELATKHFCSDSRDLPSFVAYSYEYDHLQNHCCIGETVDVTSIFDHADNKTPR